MADFTPEEKAEAFDRIAAQYYNRNFGTMMKSSLDTLMFSIFLDHCKQNGEAADDYSLSKQLGIGQAKIRALKQNEALQINQSRADHWKTQFAQYAKNARYDSTKQLVKMTIPEVVVLNELRNFIVQNGLYDEYQLNPKLFQCRLDVFLILCERLAGESVSFDDAALKKLQREAEKDEDQSAIELVRTGKWKEGILKISKSAAKELLPEMIKLIPFGGVAADLLKSLCDAILNS